MLSHKKSLNILKKTNALIEGHFVLSSGLHSAKYIQCAKLLSYPHLSNHICKSLAHKIRKNYKEIDLILAPAMGGIIIGYEIGKILKKETIFCERVNGKFKLRRGFTINKGSKVLIIEDVITTGKSSMECVKLINKNIKVENIRGNIDTRIKKVEEGKYDGAILALAGLQTLKLEKYVKEKLEVKHFIPAAGQGIIAVQCRDEDAKTINKEASIVIKPSHGLTPEKIQEMITSSNKKAETDKDFRALCRPAFSLSLIHI